jgi:hypothetical protein
MACLSDPQVARVLTVGRSTAGNTHPKLRETTHADFCDFSAIAEPDFRRIGLELLKNCFCGSSRRQDTA